MMDIAIIGAGGLGHEVATIIHAINKVKPTFNFLGFFDNSFEKGSLTKHGKILGDKVEYDNWDKPLGIVIAIANSAKIQLLSRNILNPNISFPNIVHPTVNIFDDSSFEIGKGNIIFGGCRLSCDVEIGDFNILNGLVSLGHDVKIGSHNVLGPSVRISGDSQVGNNNFFGVGSIILQGLKIGENTRIGVGSVIMRNTEDNNLYFGNPARKTIF